MTRIPPARWLALGLAAAAIVAVLTSAWLLRGRPPTVSVGDEALLEIYTLHAARGTLRVGAYSRFYWSHPGPALFYAFAPGYILSGERQDSLFATTLVLNIAVMAVLLWCLRRYWGHAMACVGAFWLLALAAHQRVASGWDFGDFLGSAWNPHAPMLMLALLIVIAAIVGAGIVAWLPGLIAAASFVVQAHVGLAPVSAALVAAAIACCTLPHVTPRASPARPVPVWARVLDGLACVYGALFAWALLIGGLDLHVAGHAVTVNSTSRLLTVALALVAIRHVATRTNPLSHVVVRGPVAGLLPAVPRPDARETRRAIIAGLLVAAAFWCLPLLQQLTGPGTGNMTQLARFAGGGAAHRAADGLAAFTYYLPGVLWRGLEVAAGGRVITEAQLAWPGIVLSVAQLAALVLLLRHARALGRTPAVTLCLMCLIASAAALVSMLHVNGDLFDHLAFWIVAVGLVNLTTIAGLGVAWAWEHSGALRRLCPESLAAPFLALALVTLAVHGERHLLAGHQQARFPEEVAATRTLTAALDEALRTRDLSGQPIAVAPTSGTWGVAAGVVLELYKRGPGVTVTPAWVPIFGTQLAPNGREAAEAAIVERGSGQAFADDPSFERIAATDHVEMYLRVLSRADRIRRRQPAS